MTAKTCCECLKDWKPWKYGGSNPSLSLTFFQRCSEARAQKCQGKQLLLGRYLNNMRKQKVKKEVKGKRSFVHVRNIPSVPPMCQGLD